MRYRIESPVRGFRGEALGVAFDAGVGHTDDSAKEQRAALEYFRRRGYTVTPVVDEAPEQDEPEPGAEQPSAPDPFSPGEHSVEDVLAHLESAGLDEAERVIQAESDGKARKTILNAGGPLLARKDEQ